MYGPYRIENQKSVRWNRIQRGTEARGRDYFYTSVICDSIPYCKVAWRSLFYDGCPREFEFGMMIVQDFSRILKVRSGHEYVINFCCQLSACFYYWKHGESCPRPTSQCCRNKILQRELPVNWQRRYTFAASALWTNIVLHFSF